MPDDILTIALPKGKLLPDSVKLLNEAGFSCPRIETDSRRLLFEIPGSGAKLIICRPTDIPTYVEQGAADIGFVGKDTLIEQNKDVAELVDLKFGYCRFVVAMPEENLPPKLADGSYDLNGFNQKRAATKFPRVAQLFFNELGMQIVPIKLHGNIELAPRVGLAEMIVDIVSTGRTLKENRLVEVAQILEATTRMVANRVSYRMKYEPIHDLAEKLRKLVE